MAKILFVDDEAAVRHVGSSILKSAGHIVEVAKDGKEALEKLEGGTYDLVVTDIIMPEVDGIQMIVEITRQNPQLPILAISGGGRKGKMDFLQIAERLGARSSLCKPFQAQELLDAVDRCLAGSATTE